MSVTVAAGELRAVFMPELGMLGRTFRRGNDDFVALPGGIAAYGDGHQTGVPLLAPWANRLDGWRYRVAGADVDLAGLGLHTDENGLPIHGTMTAVSGWEVLEEGAARLRARFDYGARPDLLAAFPFPHHLEVDAEIDGEALSIATTLRPTSDRAVPIAFGWHPYLRLPTGDRSQWRLRLPARRRLALDARGIPTGDERAEAAEAAPVGGRTFDDLYALDDDHELGLDSEDHRLTVHYETGYPYAQVFAPPGADYVCLETMTAPTNSLGRGTCPLVSPGESFAASFAISVG